jgi:hypothetical protein
MIRPPLALAAALLLAAPVQAADCPVERSGDTIADAIEKAATCAAAQKVFEACAYVASIDTQFGAVVTEKCEKDFLTKLSPAQSKTYRSQKDACARKYVKKEGTMYRSFEAMCVSKLAVGYSRRFAGKAQ